MGGVPGPRRHRFVRPSVHGAVTLSAEADLVRTAARVALGPSHRERLARLLSGPLDWDLVGQFASRHRLWPLLYRHVGAVAPSAMPKPVLVEWWRRYEHHARRNTALAHAAADAAAEFERDGIVCVPYKGPLLAQSLYGSLALRAFDDIDILIRSRDLRRAAVSLESRGYRPYYRLDAAAQAAMTASRLQYHAIYRHESGHLLELHWKTDPACPVEDDSDAWWQRLAYTELTGVRVRTFDRDTQLLMSAIHAMRHYGASLCWIVDVAEALRGPAAPDWPQIVARARSIGAWRRLAATLCIVHDVLDAPVPAEVIAAARADRAASAIARRMAARLFDPHRSGPGPAARLRTDLALRDRMSDRVSHVRSVVFDPTFHEWLAWPLPRAWYPLYVPMRLARLAGRLAARGIHRGHSTTL